MNLCRTSCSSDFAKWIVASSFLTVLCWANPVAGQDWARFLGPDGAATVLQSDVPTEWSATSNIKWKTELPGPGASSPIILGDRVYLTCYSGYGDKSNGNIDDLKRHLLCIDRANGKMIWQKSVNNQQVKNEDPYKSYITHHGYATNTPVTDGNQIYAFFGKVGVIAFDLEGNQVWQRAFEGQPNKTRWGSAASPILHGDSLIINAIDECGKILALNKSNGEILWEFDAGTRMAYSTPNLVASKDGRTDLVIAVPEKVIGLDPESGKQRWFAKTTLMNEVNASIIHSDDVVYVYGGYQGVGSLAVRVGGTGDVSKSHVLWESRDTSYVATPVIHNGHIYWMDKSGIAQCVDMQTGDRIYRQRVPGVKGGRGIKFFASMILVGDRYYSVSRESGTFVLAADPAFKVISHNQIQDDSSEFNGTPAISNNQMFLRSNRYLYCISK